uniref:V-set domain-containing T-cell activation inhibitor 1 isoform X2 n=1 Tax=Scatophagus argus TaxID=75038 RepID=UPI001ED80184|nr:V-set domain-containing T-cell activation inhibitor 1 isoform X2 [Scatophagus argus]
MASLGHIIFCSMITLIVLFSAIIILILALTFSKSSSEVMSLSTFPIASLGGDALLSCYLRKKSEQATLSKVSVTWEKEGLEGLVYQYNNGAPDLGDQNSQFKGRTQLFPDVLVTGNASLLLRDVKQSDEGVYTCSISSSDGGGNVNIHLRTAAFSAPTFTLSNDILTAEAKSWFPKPTVTWLDGNGSVLQGTTQLTENSAGIFSVISTLQPVNVSDTYTCTIENNLVISFSKATITGSQVSESTHITYSTASSLLASTFLHIVTGILCIYYLT